MMKVVVTRLALVALELTAVAKLLKPREVETWRSLPQAGFMGGPRIQISIAQGLSKADA